MSQRSITQFHGYTGVVSTYGDLLNVAGSPNQNAYLRQGDQAYVTDEKAWYLCDVDTLGSAVWVPADSGGLRRSYGDTHIAFEGRPFPMVVGTSSGQLQWVMNVSGGSQAFVSDFTPYEFCQCRVSVYDSGNNLLLREDVQFADHTAIADWVNLNVPNNGAEFTHSAIMEVFDIIDPAIVPLAKVYGKNRLWTTLSSPRKHRSWSLRGNISLFNVAGGSGLPVAALEPVIQDMLISMFPAHPAFGPAFNMSGQREMGSLWVSPVYRSRYDMPGFRPESCLVDNSGAGSPDRWAWDGGGFVAAPVGEYRYDTNAAGPHYLALDVSGTSAQFFTAAQGLHRNAGKGTLAAALLQGDSVLLCYPLVSDNGKFRSVYLKPVGIDQVYFNQLDEPYRIEAVGTHRNDKRPRLFPLQPLLNSPYQRSSGPVGVYEFIRQVAFQQNRATFNSTHSNTSGLVRFQYRNLKTGKVSPLSSATLTTIARKRGRPISWLVKNKSDY